MTLFEITNKDDMPDEMPLKEIEAETAPEALAEFARDHDLPVEDIVLESRRGAAAPDSEARATLTFEPTVDEWDHKGDTVTLIAAPAMPEDTHRNIGNRVGQEPTAPPT